MSQYMLLLYATEVEGEELAEREAEIPIFLELSRSLEEAGLLVAAGRVPNTAGIGLEETGVENKSTRTHFRFLVSRVFVRRPDCIEER